MAWYGRGEKRWIWYDTVHNIMIQYDTVPKRSSTSTYVPNFIEIEETFCGQMDGQTGGHLRPTSLGRLGGKWTKQLNPGLVASYDLWPENGAVRFWQKGKGWTIEKNR